MKLLVNISTFFPRAIVKIRRKKNSGNENFARHPPPPPLRAQYKTKLIKSSISLSILKKAEKF